MFENSFAKYVMGRPPASVAPLVMMRVTYDNGDFLKKEKKKTFADSFNYCFVLG